MVLGLQNGTHAGGIGGFVALSSVGANSRAFPHVENPELDARAVRVQGHFAAQGIQLKHHMRFGHSADGGIAGHSGHGAQIHGDKGGSDPHPCGRQGRLATGMASADHQNVK